MIVRENINFERGGENPLRNLRIGKIEVLRKELEQKNFDLDTCKAGFERLARQFAQKVPSGKVFFTKELSNALDHIFGPDFRSRVKPENTEEQKVHSDKSRQFFKDIIQKVKLNDSQLSEEDLLEYISEFKETIVPDPLWFEAIIGSLVYTAEMS